MPPVASSVETVTILVQNAQLGMRFALIVRKGGTLQKFAVEGRSARTKFQLQPGLLHLPQWVVPLSLFQSHQELLTPKD